MFPLFCICCRTGTLFSMLHKKNATQWIHQQRNMHSGALPANDQHKATKLAMNRDETFGPSGSDVCFLRRNLYWKHWRTWERSIQSFPEINSGQQESTKLADLLFPETKFESRTSTWTLLPNFLAPNERQISFITGSFMQEKHINLHNACDTDRSKPSSSTKLTMTLCIFNETPAIILHQFNHVSQSNNS